MRRAAVGVVLGVVVWFVAATLLNFILRATIAGYSAVEASMAFTYPMLVGRLLVGAGASLAAGAACAAFVGSSWRPVDVLAGLMVALFIPVHVMLWEKFPPWYHLSFLISLAPVVLAGASLLRRARAA
jgi:hypothetical protein